MVVRHCPRCELRFVTDGELREHLAVDHDTLGEVFERYRYPVTAAAQPLYPDDAEAPPRDPAPRRYLVLANQTLGGEALTGAIRERLDAGPARFTVLVPATHSVDYGPPIPGMQVRLPQASDDVGVAEAQWRLRCALELFSELGADVRGRLGPPDPLAAVAEALDDEPVDEVIVATLPTGASRWLGMDVPTRIRRQFGVPVATVVVEYAMKGAVPARR